MAHWSCLSSSTGAQKGRGIAVGGGAGHCSGGGVCKGVSGVMCTTSCSNRKDYSPSVTPKNILYEYARLV